MHGRLLATTLIAFIMIIPASLLMAQSESSESEAEEIETDRDSFTPATTIAPECRLIFEAAYSFIDNRDVAETHSFPEIVTRYGVNDWLELRLGWNYEVGGASNTVSGNVGNLEEPTGGEIESESQISYGFKAALTSQNDWLPESALIVQAGTPTSGDETASQLITTYVFGWKLPNEWKWDSSLRYGYDTSEGDHFNIWAPSTVVKIPVCEQWAVHAEYFGIFSEGSADDRIQHYVSPGVHYLVTKDLEIGVRVGWGLNDEAADFFSNVGFGWQF